jgi:hypothetical protein
VLAQDSGAERRFGGGGLGFQVGRFDRAALARGESRTTRRSSLQLLPLLTLRRFLHPSSVDTAIENGWSQLAIGSLIESAEREGYGVLITTDQNLR